MMKFMDETLSGNGEKRLSEHIQNCAVCAEDYGVYQAMVKGFNDLELVEAPAGFCESVMKRISELPEKASVPDFDGIVFAVSGIFSVLIGIGFILNMNKDAIITYISTDPTFSFLTGYIAPVYSFTAGLGAGLITLAEGLLGKVVEYVSYMRYALFVICCGLILAQFAIYRKRGFR